MTQKSKYWSPSRTFDITVKIGKIDLSSDLMEFKIITSIDLPYQTFILKLFIDTDDIILEKIYGQTPIKVTINLLETEQIPMETVTFELLYLSSDMNLSEISNNSIGMEKTRTPITITTVARQPYKTMNTYVNSIYKGKKIDYVITDLITKIKGKIKYDNNGRNKELIDQVMIPPSTLYKNLKYINKTFGIFEGLPSFTCSHDNIINIKNLTNKMKQKQTFTLYQLSMDSDNTKIINRCNDGKHYYTIREVTTNYEGNSVFAFLSPNLVHITKPRDRLSHNIQTDLESFIQSYGIMSKSKKIFFDKLLLNKDYRTTVYARDTGYELTKTFINSNLSKNVSEITEVSVIVERNIKIMNLMNVGESVEFNTQGVDSSQIAGRYILKTSEIRFNKIKDWESSAVIALIRSNRMSV